MRIDRLELEGFRNYGLSAAEFSPGINVVVGGNAQGKTNLLEAVFVLTQGRSFRTRFTKELIGFGKDFAALRAGIFSENREQSLEIRLLQNGRKQLFVNGVKQKGPGEFAGKLVAVLFSPDDLYLIKEGSAARRRLMDGAICQLRPRYGAILSEYHRLCAGKTRILRDFRDKPDLLDMLPAYERRMAEMGAQLIFYRAAWVEKLRAAAEKVHEDFSGGKERLELSYKTVSTIPAPLGLRPAELVPLLLAHQESHREAEKATGSLLSGPHKDDIEILLDGRPAKAFASQGQTRTAALSIKLAERELCQADTGEWPVLLLDDVLSELDAKRQDFVLNRVRGGQVIITCCEDMSISEKTGGRVIGIRAGAVTEVV